MRASEKAILWVLVVVPLFWVSPIRAQCSGNLLGCLDENATPQRFAVSTWTNDGHCPASGHITLMSEFPGIEFGPYVDSFFDVFTEVYRVKPEVVVMAPPPPMMPFLIHAMVDFEDPAYTDLVYAEQVMWDPGLSRLVIVRPTPCMGDEVPPSMGPMTSACFKVCHRIYYVDLGSRLVLGRPNISVTPGCTGINCAMEPCVPGAPTDYVYKVYASGTRWVLEFEYSNPAAEPRCYCVSYTGNQPQGYNVKHLAVMNAEMQTLDLTVWTTNPLHVACGTMEVFSYPPGAYISIPVQSLEASSEPYTWHIPVAAGAFDVGDTCMLAAYFSYGPEPMCPEYTDQWAVEYVIYSTQKGARTLRPEISCDPSAYVPEQLVLGVPECMIVCHDIYYIPLIFPGPGIPSVIVQEGCGPMSTPCSNPLCDPGLPGEYRYDVLRIGGTWFLEFEHSNPQHVPACYCVTLDGYTPLPQEPYLLCAMNEAHQTLDVSLWSSDCTWPWHGEFTVTTNPPGKIDPDWWVESFFDVFCLPHTWEFPVHPSLTTNPGENFQIIIECDIFGPGSDPFEGQVAYKEPVIVTPMGTLAPWNPEPPCMGDWVPPSMVPLESQCFQVCHRIYETVLLYNEGGGRPIISVTPGCQGQPMDNCVLTPCVPGGPQDFVYDVYHNGVDWILRFEYSNPYVEPVCYCVTYEGNVPYDCETFQLAALDEGHMQFEVSVRTHSNEGWECPADGFITIFSIPPGATIGPYIDSFFDVFTEWHTVSPNVDPGSFSPGETFQLVAYINYTDPAYPDRWLTEDVIVNSNGYLNILDVGGECTGDVVPLEMLTGTSECFKVCHRIYHIPISDATDPASPPIVSVIPGCYGPPHDPCLPDPACRPGGPFDYRYTVWWAGDHWELEFEYSNEQIEPVCYCVTVAAEHEPCETHTLVALDAENQLLKVSLLARDPGGVDPCDLSGTITVWADPPELYFEETTWTFAGVGADWVVYGKPTAPEPYNPNRRCQIFVEIDYDDPDQPDEVETELVEMDLSGGLIPFDVGGECTGDNVPSVLYFGQPECFIVCHDVYYVLLDFPGPGIPLVTVTPGCDPLITNCMDPTCVPGGLFDYRYRVFKVGGSWILEFEYSNEQIEPVCYCVEISSITPVPYEAYLLASLDEANQMFDVTLWTSMGGPPADGDLIVTAEPGVSINVPFMGVGPDYTTWEFPVGPGTLAAGQTFQLAVVAQFLDPIFGRLHYEETVIVTPPGTLQRWDPITPCVGDHVPPSMNDNDAECFVVCHKIYDILLNTPPMPFPPTVTITPGCFGPPFDDCLYHPECRPGGPHDYCYRFWFDGVNWHLIFEYSNPYKEPVCYCVTIGEGPCWPVTNMVIQAPNPETGVGMRLAWWAPETAAYKIYGTADPHEVGPPPGGTWVFEDIVTGTAGSQMFWYPPAVIAGEYRKYSVVVDCSGGGPER